MIQIRSFS